MGCDTGDDFAMLNAIQMRETPQQVDPLDPSYQLGDPRFVLALLRLVMGLVWHLRSALSLARAQDEVRSEGTRAAA